MTAVESDSPMKAQKTASSGPSASDTIPSHTPIHKTMTLAAKATTYKTSSSFAPAGSSSDLIAGNPTDSDRVQRERGLISSTSTLSKDEDGHQAGAEDSTRVSEEARGLLEDGDVHANNYPSVLFRPQLDDIMLDDDLLNIYEQMKSLVSRSPLKTAQLLYAFSCATDHLALDLEVRRSALDLNKKAFTFYQDNTWFAVDLDLNIDLSDDDEAYDSDPRIKILPARHSLFPSLQNNTSRYFQEQEEAHREYYGDYPYPYPPPYVYNPYPISDKLEEPSSPMGHEKSSRSNRSKRRNSRDGDAGQVDHGRDRDRERPLSKRPKTDRSERDHRAPGILDELGGDADECRREKRDRDHEHDTERAKARLERKLAKKRLRLERAHDLSQPKSEQSHTVDVDDDDTASPNPTATGASSPSRGRPLKITLVHKGNGGATDSNGKPPIIWAKTKNSGELVPRSSSSSSTAASGSNSSNRAIRPSDATGQESAQQSTSQKPSDTNARATGPGIKKIRHYQFSPPMTGGSQGPRGANAGPRSISAGPPPGRENEEVKTEDVLKKGTWTSAEEEILLEAVRDLSSENWHAIATKVPGRNAKQCMQKWQTDLDPQINRLPWTAAEDEKLVEAYHTFGNSWQQIAKMVETRTWYQCYNRVRAKSVKNKIMMTAGTHPASLANQNNTGGRSSSLAGSESPSLIRGGGLRDRALEPKTSPSTPGTPSTPSTQASGRGGQPLKIEEQDTKTTLSPSQPAERSLDRESMDGPHQAHAAFNGRLNQSEKVPPRAATGSKSSVHPVAGHAPAHPPRSQQHRHPSPHHAEGSWSKQHPHSNSQENLSGNGYRSPQQPSHQRNQSFNTPPQHSSSRPQHTQHQPTAAQKPHPGYSSQSGPPKAVAHYPYTGSGNSSSGGGAGLGIHSGDPSNQSYPSAPNPSAHQQHSMMPPPPSSSHQSPRQPGLHQTTHNSAGGNEHQGQSPVLHHPSQVSAHQRQHSTGAGGQAGISQSPQGGPKAQSGPFQSRPSGTTSAISPMAAIQQAKTQVRLQQQQAATSQKSQPQHIASRDHGQGQSIRRQEPPSPQQQQQQQFGSPNSSYSGQHARLSNQSSPLQSASSISAPVAPRTSHPDNAGVQQTQPYNQLHGAQKPQAMAIPRTASPTMPLTTQRPVQPVSHPGSNKAFAAPVAGSSNNSNNSGSPNIGHGSNSGPAVVTTPKSSTYSAPPLAPPLLSPSIANSPTGFISTSTLLMMARNANANTNPQGSPLTGPTTPSPTSSSTLSPSMNSGQQQHPYGGPQSHYHRQQ